MNTHAPIHFLNAARKFTVNSIFFLISLHFLKLSFTGWQIGLIMAFYALDISTNNFFYKDLTAMDQNRKYGLVSFWLAVGMAGARGF